MAKKKKQKLSILSIVLLAVAAAGVVLAVVGVAIPWFSTTLGTKTTPYGLFNETLANLAEVAQKADQLNIPLASVQAFGLITLILGAITCVATLLQVFGVVKLKLLIRIICVALVVACAVIALALALSLANVLKLDGAAGIYLLLIGGIVAAVPLLLVKN